MNWNEIENTVQSLVKRHSNLDDVMLRTLLLSGGWDEKEINKAIGFYHYGKGEDLLPKLEEEKLLPTEISSEHLLLEHNQNIEKEEQQEPQSLISPSVGTIVKTSSQREKDTELPHDLPLRPFESTSHVWPFSRYKDVFYGDVMPTPLTLTKEEEKLAKKSKAENIYLARIPITKKERELLIFVSTMLLIVLLLLGYMYFNGRL